MYHVKFECDGYLPFYLKDFGTGSYTVGSGDSWDTVTLVPGDTTYNADNDNQWSDDVINSSDSAYVQSCLGATRGDSNFNPSMDADGDNVISQADLDAFCAFYENLADDEYYTLSQYVQSLDINLDGVINDTDYKLLEESGASESELADFKSELDTARTVNSWVYIYNHEMTGDVIVNKEDYEQGLAKINTYAQKRGRSDNYFEYMDKDNNGTIENSDVSWFSAAYSASGDLDWDHAFKRNLKVLAGGEFPYSFNLHDTNLDLNGQTVYVADCMSFTTDMPQFWSGNGATLDINGGKLLIENNLVFRTASPDGWGGSTGQLMNLNGGEVYIGGDFNFGQANCYDTVLMVNSDDYLEIRGNWNYITLTDMEGKWTAGGIAFLGPIWEVNEASGDKSIYSSGTHQILFFNPYGKQTILWDNCETYINNEDGSLNTKRRFNFDYVDADGYCMGLIFPYGYSSDLYWFRPWFRPYDLPDYTLYRRGWEIGDGVHIATGNYTKSFTDLSIRSAGIQSDFVRTYNSTNEEEGSFGIGWDFNIDVSKIIEPAEGWYQVVMPDGSNSTFKEENGSFKCENNRNKMRKSGSDFIVTIPDQTEYYYNSNMKLYKIVDSEVNTLTISDIASNIRTVTDATGRTYKITYNGNSEHQRVIKIEDTTAGRTVSYEYNSDFQLVSATNVAGGKETYSYDSNGHMNKITNCYDETEDQITYFKDGKVDYLVNASGQKQEYTYDKAKKQTGVKEYDGKSLIKSIKYDYDEKYAVNKNVVTADGQTYEVDKVKYLMTDGENKYDEESESTDIMGNTTKYDRDDNGNVTKTTNPDSTYTLTNYNNKNSIIAEVDENGYATIKAYDGNGTRLIKEAKSLNPLSQSDINTVTAKNFDPVAYLSANESSYAITSHEYYADSYVSGVIGLIKKTTDPEGNITEYDYYKSGNGKGLVSEKWVYGNGISKPEHGTRYEYNAQLQISKETSPDGSVKEYEYDKFNNKTSEKNFGKGNSALITLTEYDKLGRKTAEYAPNYSADKSKGNFTPIIQMIR